MNKLNFGETVLVTINAIIVYLLGEIDTMIISLFVLMAIDYITGVIDALYHKELNSKIGIKGILKKLMMIAIISTSVIVDRLVGQGGMFRSVFVMFFIANEGISILENCGSLGVLPDQLKKYFEQLKGGGKNE